ncbi:MAG: hypothetical protein ABR964_16285 [Tepidisphaeraceae bacterium]|jgi:hypothetical protein
MNDLEIESLLQDAGYRFDLAAGLYIVSDGDEGDFFDTQDIADELEIPVDDLIRWEAQQRYADDIAAD